MFQWVFIIDMSDARVLMSPGYLIKFPSAVSLIICVSVFWNLTSQTNYMYIAFLPTGMWYWYTNNTALIPTWYSKPYKNYLSFLKTSLSRIFNFYFCWISIFKCISSCLLGDAVCDGTKCYQWLQHIISNKKIFFNCIGAGWLFYYCYNL